MTTATVTSIVVRPSSMVADREYDSGRMLAFIWAQGTMAIKPSESHGGDTREYDRELYPERNLME